MARLVLKDGKSVKELGHVIYELSQEHFNTGLENELKNEFFEREFQKADGTNVTITIKIVYDTEDTVHIVIPYYEKGDNVLEETGAEALGQTATSGCGK